MDRSGALALTTSYQTVATGAAGTESALYGQVFANSTGATRTVTLEHHRQATASTVEFVWQIPANTKDFWDKSIAFQPSDTVRVKADAVGVSLLWSYDEDDGTTPVAVGWAGRGPWSSVVTYGVNDVTEVSGTSFISLQADNLNHAPDPAQVANTAWWMINAAKGAPGADGASTAAAVSFTPTGNIAATSVQTALAELDTEKAPLASPALTGTPTAPTPASTTNTTQIATTAMVQAVAVDKAPLASPALTGAPTAPTPSTADDSTKIATTAHVQAVAATKAPLASPTFTGTPAAPTPATTVNTTQLATTAFVQARLAEIIGSAPSILDTFQEVAAALQADETTAAALATTVAGKQPLDATLTALAALTTAANKMIYATGVDTFSLADLTSYARTLLDDSDATTMRTTLGLAIGTDVQAYSAKLAAIAALTYAADTMAYATGTTTFATTTVTSFIRSLLDDTDAATARATLGLVIGTNVQAYDADLAAIAGLTSAADALPYFTGSGTAAVTTLTTAGRALIDDADAAAQRVTMGIGTIATRAMTISTSAASGGSNGDVWMKV